MAESLGTIRGQVILDVKQALAAYTETRLAHLNTVTALHSGASAMRQSGAAIAGVGALMVGGFLVAVQAASEFERKLDYFGAVSASTQDEYDAIREKALQLGADTIYSANQIADSFVELGKSGVSAKDIINGIGEGVAALGAAADIPLDTAANIITGAVATFQLGAGQAVSVADQLAGAANASTLDVEDLGVSLKYAGGVASSLGVSFSETNTALALLGKYGIKGSTAGTSLRQVLLGLNGSTKKARTALKELGIITDDGANKFYNADGSAKSLSEVFQILQDSTEGMSDQQRTATMQQIFATRALPTLIALTNEGAEGFSKMADEIGKTTAAEVAGKRLDNLSGDIEILRGNIDTLLISSGSGFQGFARSIVQGLTSLLQGFLNLSSGTQTVILSVIAIGGAFLVVIGTLGIFAGFILNIVALAMQLAPVLSGLRVVIMALNVIKTIGAAFAAFNAILMANPIILIITLIVLLIAGLIWFFTQTEVGKQAWSSFMRFLSEAWANIVSVATTIWSALGSFFTDTWNNIKNGILTFVNWAINAFLNFTPLGLIISHWSDIVSFFTTLWTNITTGIVLFVTNAITFFQQLPQNIAAFFQALPGMVGYAIGFLLGTIVRIMTEIGVWLITNVPIMINNVVTFFSELPGKIIIFIMQLYNDVTSWILNMQITAMVYIAGLVTDAISFFQQLPGRVLAFVMQLASNVMTGFQITKANAVNTASNLVTNVINFFQQLPGRVLSALAQMAAFVLSKFNEAKATAVSIASGIVSTITETLNRLPGAVSGIFGRVVSAIKELATRAFNAVRDFAAGLWNGFKDGLGIHSPSYIEHAMWAITGVIDEETRLMRKQVRTIQGLGNGISEIGDNLGFKSGLDDDLSKMYEMVAATKSLQDELSSQTALGVDATQTLTMKAMADQLKDLKQETNIDVKIDNPAPEPASTSLPRAIRQTTYMVG